jgi:predicted alpha-1,2-mannosidase
MRYARLGTGLLAAAVLLASGPGAAGVAHAAAAAVVTDPASLVNTTVMTTGGGNDFPGVDVPFGMVQWSPDTSPNRSAGGGYNFNNTQLRGFSLTHLAGPGCGAMGDLPIVPMTGALPAGDPGVHNEPFTHTGEIAQAGLYSVMSGSGSNIKTELTATTRSGMARWTYPSTTQADILIKLRDSQNGTSASSVTVVGNTEVSGSATSGGFCGNADSYTVYFDMVFDQPFAANPPIQAGPNTIFLTFNTTANRVVQAKVGISFVSVANARANWQAENGSGFAFDTVATNAHNAWNGLLNKIQIAGGTATQQQLFYTSLYHVLQHPNVVSDTNGQYTGFDRAVHTMAAGHAQYNNFSGWDIFHGQTQLSALVAPNQTSDIAQSLLNDAAQGSTGLMPQWGYMNSYNFVMAGDPAEIAIANYYAFGARNFDTATAKTVMVRQSTTTNQVRPETALEDQYGYIPSDGTYGCCNAHGFLASQLEYDQADFALSRFLLAAPNPSASDMSVSATMLNRANNWKNVYNPANKLLNPKLRSGAFVSGITNTSTNQYIEGTAAQYRFVVPFNQPALASLLGGNATTNTMLDSFFTVMDGSNGNNAYLSNEFDLGTPWFYNWTGAPSHTQSVVNRMLNQFYHDTPSGFPDNDDLGTMSANYVWGALGFYPVTPGSADLMFNSPQFTQAIIHLPSGATMTVNAPQASATNFFVQSLNVNGAASTGNWIPGASWQNGVTLDFTLGSAATSWGSGSGDAPPAYNGVAVPGNLALNHPATADSSCNANESPDKAVNGSVSGGNSDKWCSLGAIGSQFLRVDLGANHSVNQIVVDHAGAGGEQVGWNTAAFNLQVSTDGTTFTTVATVTGNTASITTHNITPVTARYVRLNVVTPTGNGNGAARIYELQVFGT